MSNDSNQDKMQRNASSVNSAPSIISADVKIVGNISTVGELQLDGIVEGDVICSELTMGEHGGVTGTISAENLVIRGTVAGTMRARSVRLEKTAKVSGDVWHETLSVEAGARIEGQFVHDSDPVLAKPKEISRSSTPEASKDAKSAKGDAKDSAKAADAKDADVAKIPEGGSGPRGRFAARG
jgi:cytoskeletal protein CcmA (bactofilin family)